MSSKPRILLLNSFLKTFTGSEIVTLELAEIFLSLSYDVTVATFEYGYPIVKEFHKSNIFITNILDIKDSEAFDIIWAHHFTTIEYCLTYKNLSYSKLIYSSLSPKEPLECPPVLFLEKITLFLANSLETKNTLINLGINEHNIELFSNPVKNIFFQNTKTVNKLESIVIISNHIPGELLECKGELEDKGLNVDIIGKGYLEIRVTPDILLKYDAIITIGKTVQYGLALGMPVYCYDIWGGPGWLTPENIDEASEKNFSGRDTPYKKDAYSIAKEIIEDYPYNHHHYYISYAKKKYDASSLIHNILNKSKQSHLNVPKYHSLLIRHNEFYYNKIHYESFLQVFFDEDGKFSENFSIKRPIFDKEYVNLRFSPQSKVIRLDLTNRPSIIYNLGIHIIKDETKVKISNYEMSGFYLINDGLLTISNDSQIIINLSDEKRKFEILVEYEIYFSDSYEFASNALISNMENKYLMLKNENEYNKVTLYEKGKIINIKNNVISKLKLRLYEKERVIDVNNKIISNLESRLLITDHQLDILSLSKENLSNELNKVNLEIYKMRNSRAYYIMNYYQRLKNSYTELNIKLLGLFNSKFYLEHNEDVKNANVDPYVHYVNYGWKENRDPSSKFSTTFYLNSYPDVKEAQVNPLLHYYLYGRKEGRLPIPPKTKLKINSILNLVRDNPKLILGFLSALKNRGVRSTLLKLKTKLENYNVQDKQGIISIDSLLDNYNISNFNEVISFYRNKNLGKVDIIIPIYNGFEFLSPLFDSLVKNTSIPYRLIIGNDLSPDSRIVPFIQSFINKNKNKDIDIIFINNKVNLGFLKTVNALAKFVKNHMVILNTDTEVPPFWLERLMYPIFKEPKVIASTTPFTNAGTICSFPEYLKDNTIYRELDVTSIDRFFQNINVNTTMLSVPTGVGFCMGMNFNVVKKIGVFDEIYGKGYGEENDWCQRAIQVGYKNVHITNLFVYHKHGGSFLSEDKIKYINEHYNILISKHPNYDHDIQDIIKKNELKGLRDFITILIDFKQMKNVNLIIDHNLGGGANSYRNQRISELLKDGNPSVLYFYDSIVGKFMITMISDRNQIEFYAEDHNVLSKLSKYIIFSNILVNGLVSFPNIEEMLNVVLQLKDKLQVKLIFPIHDYFEICPSYTLLDDKNEFCNIPENLNKCKKCLARNTNEFKVYCNERNIVSWRKIWAGFLNKCDFILYFSHSSRNILLKAYPEIEESRLVYKPHNIEGRYPLLYPGKPEYKKRVIGVLGNINFAKGRGIVEDLVEYIDSNQIDILLVLIGNIDVDISSKSFIKTGSYTQDTLINILNQYSISEFLIPSIWPETFSYTTDEIMQLGYPLTVFDIGAPAERVKNYSKGRVISLTGSYIKEICKEWL